MAGVRVTVCLPPEAADDVERALDEALAPFYLDSSDNPVDRGMWDSRRINGGSDGTGFAVAPGHENDPRLIHDDPRYDGTPCPSSFGVCAGGPRALLDFSRPLAASESAVAASWDLWHRLSAVHPPAVPLEDFVDRWWNDPDAFPDDRWGDAMFAAYKAQPLIHAYLSHPHSLGYGSLWFPDPAEHPVIGYDGDRAAYIRDLTSPHQPDTDVLTLDGWWRESGGNAVHASCDPGLCPHERPGPAVWPGSEAYLATLPGDTILVRLRCHA
ncbi:hypothetical protein GCM10017674_79590 [Streptomyces gardneri]|uniref:Uncharacterized protein n=2 Tax=Streptomyces gardneri TaxID=66892 RepID=A0A4Y3S1F5_9ACTN|nr:hypothetical protein SGA01_76450 [Streptomyces gardneri]GHH23174.1 hypothetical protein GCM10017674_79590 [Streptomyces gardneri]